MGYDRWVEIKVKAVNIELQIKNAKLKWGKFHDVTSKDSEYDANNIINQIRIPPGEYRDIATCGRQGAWSGTEGSFDIYDADNDKLIGTYYWDCPYSAQGRNTPNTSTWKDQDPKKYKTTVTGARLEFGPLGYITIKCEKK